MKKIRVYLSRGAEEKFLNKIAAKGYRLKSITPFILMPPLEMRLYEFDPQNAKQLMYQIDYRSFSDKEEQEDYLQLLKDDGWQYFRGNHVQKSGLTETYYLFKERNEEQLGLFSDQESRINSENKYYSSVLISSILLLGVALIFKQYPTAADFSSLNALQIILKYWFISVLLITILITGTFQLVNKMKLRKVSE